MIQIKRVYDSFEPQDGFRILVDRIWPRGLAKQKAQVDLWLREIAPSTSLRKWFDHDPVKWIEFKKHYFLELEKNDTLIKLVKSKTTEGDVTLLYAAKDCTYNNAVALKEFLENQ